MNRLSHTRRVEILQLLVEGNSLRGTSRLTRASINTVTKLLVDVGTVCAEFHHEHVREVPADRIQCDELWSFCYAKRKNLPEAVAAPSGAGDVWTWTALDPDSKLLVSWLVGPRTLDSATAFMDDLRFRLLHPVELSTDQFSAYPEAIETVFGAAVQHGFGANTSLVERQNLTIRMGNRRFMRRTNGFSKKLENHCHQLALYFYWFNWCRRHQTIEMTPAMAAGLAEKPLTLKQISRLAVSN